MPKKNTNYSFFELNFPGKFFLIYFGRDFWVAENNRQNHPKKRDWGFLTSSRIGSQRKSKKRF
jgi:hypothetical protein